MPATRPLFLSLWLAPVLSVLASGGAAAETEERCRRGIEAADGGEHALAHALLADCSGDGAERAQRAAREALEAGEFAPVSVAVIPEGAEVTVSAFPEETFRGSLVLWLPYGEHDLQIDAPGRRERAETVKVEDRSRISVVVELEEESDDADETTIDFGEEAGAAAGDPVSTADPGPKDHETLLPERFRRGGNAQPSGERDGRIPALPFYVGGGLSVMGGVLFHLAGESDGTRYTAYGLYGLGAVGLGLGAFFHLRSEEEGPSYAIGPAPGGGGLFAAVHWTR